MTRSRDELTAVLADLVSDAARQAVADTVPGTIRQTILEVIPGVVGQEVEHAVSRLTVTVPDTAVLLSIDETAKRLGLGATTTKNLIAAGQIRSVMVERRRLVPVEAIHEHVHGLEKESARLRVLPTKRSRPTGT
jgi:excisionase family DNA binding protein